MIHYNLLQLILLTEASADSILVEVMLRLVILLTVNFTLKIFLTLPMKQLPLIQVLQLVIRTFNTMVSQSH